MTIGEDHPSLSDFPRVIPPHQCWRNGGVECRACEIEEQQVEEELDAFCGLRLEGNVCDRPTGHSGWWSDDRCTHGTSWTTPVNGAGTWKPSTTPHRESVTDLLVAFLACLLGLLLLAGLVVAGRSVMCRTHSQALSYCDGAANVSDGGER